MINRRTLVIGVIAVSLAGFAGASYFAVDSRKPISGKVLREASPLVRADSPRFGPDDAPVTIVEFFDPACEACRAYHPFVKRIIETFPGKVRLMLRYAAFHEPSVEAISILEAARLQGLFEPVLETLFKAQPQWAPHGRPGISPWDVVGAEGLDVVRARREASLPGIVAVLNRDAADTNAIGIRKTPTFFVNGKQLTNFGMQQLFDLVKREVETMERASAGKS
tara:strand:- start:889 stop:1557 length:669 start_codon:yes stop_codon:yes gene_type:complete